MPRKGVFYMIKYILTAISLVSSLNPISGVGVNALPEQGMAMENPKLQVEQPKEELLLWVTAYSSTPEETDDTPFITAKGTQVRDGVIATNKLPFGTRIKIPKLFGDKIFVVEDRMHRRKENFMDVWMPSKEAAENFGINYTTVVVLE